MTDTDPPYATDTPRSLQRDEGLAAMPTPDDPHGTGCGCKWRGGRPFRCDFHQGYEEGRAVSNQIIMEMQAKLDHANGRITRDVMLDRIMAARR